MQLIIEYIKEKYNPLSVILYGSYANGTNNLNSDFDALVISNDHSLYHDTSFVSDIQLDVFVYPVSFFTQNYDCNNFIQIFDGKIILDNDNVGTRLKDNVQKYINNLPYKTHEEIRDEIDWCLKMLDRVKRNDVEGMFRWHWLLIDSLEIFCDIVKHRYLGPKKTLIWMKENYYTSYECYKNALVGFDIDALSKWIYYMKDIAETQ